MQWHPDFGNNNDYPLHRSAIIGHVRLLGYVYSEHRTEEAIQRDIADLFRDAGRRYPRHGDHHVEVGNVLWIVDQPVMLDRPIPAKGRCNLWTFDA